ncbi:MAG: A/G-specific adenine glycosylase [Tannerellaceae bacterium]
MLQIENDLEVSNILINWYNENKRELPWRESTDPYIIWISEIILQQTRVAQGTAYFLRFVNRFPNVATLASAEEGEVLKFWQGLGYYSRARNLLEAARRIMGFYGGVFPKEYADVLSLKGIGEYTAAAIVSFSRNKPYPVVDGNVYRVLSRLFAVDTPIDTGTGKKQFAELAGLLLNPLLAGLHNQAIMEFGALQCVPQRPDCTVCPFADRCVAYADHDVQSYPVKQNKTKTRNRYFYYFYIRYGGKTYLHRRADKDIWEGLFEFPLIETEQPMDYAQLQETDAFRQLFADTGKIGISVRLSGVKHVLSHQLLFAAFYEVEIEMEGGLLHKYQAVPLAEVSRYAVPRLIHLFLEKEGIG